MAQKINLKELERQAWTANFDDGLYDLFLGWLILWMGIVFTIDDYILSTPVMLVINMSGYLTSVLLLYLGKHFISAPRMGRVRYSRRRLSRLTWVTAVTFVIVTAVFGLSLRVWSGQESLIGEELSKMLSPFLLGLFLLVLFNVPAFFLDYKHLHFIGLMFALPIPASAVCKQFFGFDPGFIAFAIPAAAVLLLGGLTLRRFLQQHPLPVLPSGENGNVTT